MDKMINLKTYFDSAIPFAAYLDRLADHLALHQLHYKKFEVDASMRVQLNKSLPVKVLVITEPWCGDSLALLPVVYKMCEQVPDCDIRIVLRDQHPELMDKFVTHGARAIPIFLFMNSDYELQFQWGPRPKTAKKIFADHKALIDSGNMTKSEVIKMIRAFYAKDRGRETAKELLAVLKNNYEIVKSAL
jgi:hypothetical protein